MATTEQDVIIPIQVDTKDAAQAVVDFSQKMEESSTNVGNNEKSLKSLRNELKQYRADMANSTEGTHEYAEAVRNAGRAQEELDDIMEVSRGAAIDWREAISDTTREIAKGMTAISGAYTAYRGVAELTGRNNAALEESFVKLQSVMAITQGLTALTTGLGNVGRSLNTLKGIMIAHPLTSWATIIGAVGVAVTLFATNLESSNKVVDAHKKLMEDGKTANDNFKVTIDSLSTSTGALTEANKKLVEQELLQLTIQRDLARVNMHTLEQELNRLKNSWWASPKRIGETRDAWDQAKVAYAELVKTVEDGAKAIEEAGKRTTEAGKTTTINTIKNVETNVTTQSATRSGDVSEEWLQEQELIRTMEQYRLDTADTMYSALAQYAQDQATLEIAKIAETTLAYEQAAEQQQLIDELKRKSALSSAEQIFAGVNGLLGDETALGKAAAVASTTISTYQSATEAYKSQAGIPVAGPALGVAAAAAAITAGLANVKKILSVKVPAVKGVKSGSSSGTTGTPTAIPQPIATLTSPIVETHTNMTSSEVDRLSTAQRVYVVESDITDVQKRVRVVENETSY